MERKKCNIQWAPVAHSLVILFYEVSCCINHVVSAGNSTPTEVTFAGYSLVNRDMQIPQKSPPVFIIFFSASAEIPTFKVLAWHVIRMDVSNAKKNSSF